MLILALDTSTDQAGIALVDDAIIRAEWTWTAAGNHSSHLDRLLRMLLATERVNARELDAIVVATGPGSFSGLRVGVSYAKGLALAVSSTLIGVGTLDTIAFAGVGLAPGALAAIPAGREQLYVGQFRCSEQGLARVDDYAIMLPGAAAALVGAETLLCGPGADSIATELTRQARPARIEPAVRRLRRPGYLAELGRQALVGGAENQVYSLEPLYIRRSAAEEKRLAHGDWSRV